MIIIIEPSGNEGVTHPDRDALLDFNFFTTVDSIAIDPSAILTSHIFNEESIVYFEYPGMFSGHKRISYLDVVG